MSMMGILLVLDGTGGRTLRRYTANIFNRRASRLNTDSVTVAKVNIEQLGSIGELIAAVATIATLGYLAVQIRASASAVRAEGRRSLQDVAIEVVSGIASDENVSRIFRPGLRDPRALEPEERFRFRLLIAQYLLMLEATWIETQGGTASAGELEAQVLRIKTILLTPGGRHGWAQQATQHVPEFQRFVEVIMEEQLEVTPDPASIAQEGAATDSA